MSVTNIFSSEKEKKKVQNGWAMYDWSNSVYNLVITSTIFPAYYEGITSIRENGVIVNDQVSFFGWEVTNTSLFNYAVAFAYFIIVLISPILSSIADVKGNKLQFMKLFCIIGALSCSALYFFERQTLEYGIFCFIFATIGYCGSLVFYNSYLPEIATLDERDKLSAKGFAFGYIGSFILQIISFLFVMFPKFWGQEDAIWGSRFSFFLVGIWWLGFAMIPFLRLKKVKHQVSDFKSGQSIYTAGFIELKRVFYEVRKYRSLSWYLAAFFFYSMGVQTVMLAATLFGSKTLNLAKEQLIITILLIQLVAIAGSYTMSALSNRWGNIRVLMVTVFIWIIICSLAYFIHTAYEFYGIACMVGFVMGGIQSLSRSTFSKLMPDEIVHTTSYFSFYDITEKVAIVFGMFTFGFIEHITSNMRNSIFALVSFFAVGLILLFVCLRKMRGEMKLKVDG